MNNNTKNIKSNNNSSITKQNTNLNFVPSFLFTPLKRSKQYIVIVNILSSISVILCGLKIDFTSSNLENISKLTLTTVFVIGALGLNIFKMELDSTNDRNTKQSEKVKNDLIYSYIGTIFLCSSIAILGYLLSLLDINTYVNKIYCIVALILLIRMISSTLSTLVAYFNIRY